VLTPQYINWVKFTLCQFLTVVDSVICLLATAIAIATIPVCQV
jgi:hypothetical protein